MLMEVRKLGLVVGVLFCSFNSKSSLPKVVIIYEVAAIFLKKNLEVRKKGRRLFPHDVGSTVD